MQAKNGRTGSWLRCFAQDYVDGQAAFHSQATRRVNTEESAKVLKTFPIPFVVIGNRDGRLSYG